MPFVLIAVGLGAWRAWQRSPLYSLKTNVQPAGTFLLMVMTVTAGTMWILTHPAGGPSTGKAALVTAATLVVLAGFLGIIFRIAGGPIPSVAEGDNPSETHRRRLAPWIQGTAFLLVSIGLSACFAPPTSTALPWAFGTMLLATAVLCPLYLKALRLDRGMTALMSRPWIHWEYTAEQWQSWAEIQRSWERANTPIFRWKREWWKVLAPLIILAVASGKVKHGGAREKTAMFLTSATILLASAGLLTWSGRREPERRYRRMLTARREAFMGSEGLCCGGEYSPWVISGSHLIEATALHDPTCRLVLTFGSYNGYGAVQVARMIPIPEGCERDLTVLQKRLPWSCPKAVVRLTGPASRLA